MREVLAICLVVLGMACGFVGLGYAVVMLLDWAAFHRILNKWHPGFILGMILSAGILFYVASFLVSP